MAVVAIGTTLLMCLNIRIKVIPVFAKKDLISYIDSKVKN
jgi:hypothetical protein